MAVTRHVYRIYIKAPIDTVWNALLDPELTRQWFHGTAFDGPPAAGAAYRTSLPDGSPAVDGMVEVMEAPHRLVMTWHTLYDAALAEEPASRVEWVLAEVGDGLTQLDLVHGDLAFSPLTWAHTKDGWIYVLDGLKSVLETGAALPTLSQPIEPIPDPAAQWHRQQGVEANNSVWEILGRSDEERTADDDEELIRRAYAAAYHWDRAAGTGPANSARADWLLSRAWAVRGQGDLALHHADRCAATCAAHDLIDFDLAYAHESRARALACLGRLEEAAAERARAAAVPIADPEDAEIVVGDLASEPWFGLPSTP